MAENWEPKGQLKDQNKNEEQLDNIYTVVGDIEESFEDRIDSIISLFGDKSPISVALGLNVKIEAHLNVISNMIIAIAALLYGDKGINNTTNFGSLVGKIKPSLPLNEIVSSECSGESQPIEGTIKFIVEGITKGSTTEISKLLEILKELDPDNSIEGINNLIIVIDKFSEISKKINKIDGKTLGTSIKEIVKADIAKIFKVLSELSSTEVPSINMSKIINPIILLAKELPEIDVKSLNDSIKEITKADIPKLFKMMEKISAVKLGKNSVDVKAVITPIKDITEQLGQIKIKTLNSIGLESVISAIESLQIISESLGKVDTKKLNTKSKEIIGSNLPKLFEMLEAMTNIRLNPASVKLFQFCTKIAIKSLISISENLAEIKINKSVVNNLENLNKSFNLLINVFKSIDTIKELNTKISDKFANKLKKTISQLVDIVSSIEFDKKKLKDAEDSFKPIESVFKGLERICIAATVIGLLAIPATIGLIGLLPVLWITKKFILPRLAGMSLGDKETKLSFEGAENLGKLLLVMTGSLIIGAIFMWMGLGAEAFKFLVFMSLYLIMIGVVAGMLVKAKEVLSKGLEGFAVLIATLTICLIIGAIFMLSGLWKEALKFGAILALYVLTIGLILTIIKVSTGDSSVVAKFAKLIIALTLCLVIGALFMLIPEFADKAWEFGLMLAGFVFLISLSLILVSIVSKEGNVVGQFAKLLLVIAGILIIGALLMNLDWFYQNTMDFAILISCFVAVLCLSIGLLAVFGKGGDKLVMMLSIMIGILTFSLLIGAYFMLQGYAIPALEFIGLSLLLVGAFSLLAFGLGYIAAPILLGTIVMGSVSVVIMLMAVAIRCINDLFNDLDKGAETAVLLIKGLVDITLQLGIFAAELGVLGLFAPVILLGSVALVAISVAIELLAESMETIVETQEIDGLSKKITSFFKNVDLVIDGFKDIDLGLKLMLKIGAMSATFMAMGLMIFIIGKSIEALANLKVSEEYDNKGNPTKFRSLKKKDFEDAAENIKTIILTIGGAIIDTYNSAPKEMFQLQGGWFNKRSTFQIVIESCTAMGKMISSIAEGVATMSNLTVATKWNSEGKPIEFRALKDSDFNLAAKNINKIIRTLGEAIIHVYKTAPQGMFELKGGWFNKTSVFQIVLDSCIAMGKMISSIAEGVATMANLTVATKWDKEGKPIDFRTLTDDDFSLAERNIGLIITTLAKAIMDVYNNPLAKGMFELKGGWFSDKKSVFQIVVDSCTAMGTMISNITAGLVSLASATIPTAWDKEGKPIAFERLDLGTVLPTVRDNLTKIITALAESIIAVHDIRPDLFQTSLFESDTKFKRVIDACTAMGGMLSAITKGIIDIQSGRIPNAWNEKGEPIGWISMGEINLEELKHRITVITTSILNAISDTYSKNEDLFEDSWLSDSPIKKIADSAVPVAEMLKNMTDAIKNILGEQAIVNNSGRVASILTNIIINLFKVFGNPVGRSKNLLEYIYDNKINSSINAVNTVISNENFKNLFTTLSKIIPDVNKMDKLDSDALVKFKFFISSLADLKDIKLESFVVLNTIGELKTMKVAFKNIGEATPDFNKLSELSPSAMGKTKIFVKGLNNLRKIKNKSIQRLIIIGKHGKHIEDGFTTISTIIPDINNLNSLDLKAILKMKLFVNGLNTLSYIEDKTFDNITKLKNASPEISQVIRAVNEIDINKTDKFIELSNALIQLSENMNSLDNGIFVMLEKVSLKLNEAAKIIERSDELQEKRVRSVKEQAKEISKLINKPMKLEFKAEEQNSLSDKIKSIWSGETKEDKKENTQKQQVQKEQPEQQYDNSAELASLAGTVSEIQSLLYQILQQRG